MSKRKIKNKKTSKNLEQKVANLIVEGKDLEQILNILDIHIFELLPILEKLKKKADRVTKNLK